MNDLPTVMRRYMALFETVGAALSEAVPSTPEFRRWFAGSKVVDDHGQPLRCFHGTKKDFEPPFQPFTHFGTSQTANDRIGDQLYDFERGRMRLYPVFLRILKPFRFIDYKHNGYGDVLRAMLQRRLMTRDELNNILGERSMGPIRWHEMDWGDPSVNQRATPFILERLEQHGFDGLTYTNKYEGVGSVSWVIFHPEQVWHEFQ